jgi:hypothetical protein
VKRLLKEPLLHFLLLGAVLFAAYSLMSKHSGGDPSGGGHEAVASVVFHS